MFGRRQQCPPYGEQHLYAHATSTSVGDGGELIVFADREAGIENGPGTLVVNMPHILDALAPILYTLPLQLLSYYVAVLKGTDVDQPRNLAKSVTVE